MISYKEDEIIRQNEHYWIRQNGHYWKGDRCVRCRMPNVFGIRASDCVATWGCFIIWDMKEL